MENIPPFIFDLAGKVISLLVFFIGFIILVVLIKIIGWVEQKPVETIGDPIEGGGDIVIYTEAYYDDPEHPAVFMRDIFQPEKVVIVVLRNGKEAKRIQAYP